MNALQIYRAPTPAKRVDLEAAFRLFLKHYEGELAESTIRNYARSGSRFFAWIRDRGTARPTEADVMRYKHDLKKKGLSAATVNLELAAIRRLFRWFAARGDYIDIAGPVRNFKLGKTFKRSTLNETEANRLLRSIDRSSPVGKRDYALFLVGFNCGVRSIEAQRARIGDLQKRDEAHVLVVFGKGQTERDPNKYVILMPHVYNAIMDYLAERQKKTKLDAAAPLFASHSRRNKNAPLVTRTLRHIFRERATGAGFHDKQLTFHSMRHTAATNALRNGADIVAVRDMLRHASLESTSIYVRQLDRLEKGAERFNRFGENL